MKPGQFKRERQALVGALAVSVGILWAYYAYAITPLLRRMASATDSVHRADVQLKHISQMVGEMPQLQQEHDRLAASVKTLREGLPSEERLPAIIEFLSDLASQTGVRIQTIFPQRSIETLGVAPGLEQSVVKPPELYRGIPIQIDALAGFHQLGAFLARVESGSQPVQLRSLRISGNPKELRRHNIKLVLLVYFASEARAAHREADRGEGRS
jgi:Tfp pilus assembly protein PilO